MSDPSAVNPPAFPTPRETVRITEDFTVLEVSSYYRGKTNAYIVERTWVMSILDKSGHAVEGKWEADWIEVAPGIETRRENQLTVYGDGTRRQEVAKTGSVRIHGHACPAHVQLRRTAEYNDYDDSQYSTSESWDYWIRYEA
jgi:hypothetical protein